MNGADLADGYAEGARAALAKYWRHVPDAARFSPFQRSLPDRMLGRWMTLNHRVPRSSPGAPNKLFKMLA
jgi:NTE family protein